jgi:hypothetical protein
VKRFTLRRLAPLIVLPIAVVASTCTRERDGSADQATMLSAAAPPAASVGRAAGRPANDERAQEASARRGALAVANPGSTGMQLPPAQTIAPSSMVIRHGDVAVQVDSLEVAIAAVRALATRVGGYVGNVAISTGEHQVRSATLELKIPAARFDEAMTGMRPLGEVERSVASAEDVGEEFVDITARVANAKRLEARLLTLLTTRAGKLEDVLAMERELARVREEIERYEGRLRYIGSRVATSTVMVNVHEKAPLVATSPGTNILKQAFVNMWRNFVRFVAGGIELLGVLIPVAVIALVGWLVWSRWQRRTSPAPVAEL